jgi:hypothetical protein
MIELFTLISQASQDEMTVAHRLNGLNSRYVLGQYHIADGAICSRHIVSFDGGLLPRQFVKTVRRFSGSFREAISGMSDLLSGED